MDKEVMMQALKIDLGITTTAYDVRLLQLLEAAKDAIRIEGIRLNEQSISDGNLVVMYAAWLWRKRDAAGDMPRSLRWMLNNRLFSQKLQEE